MNAGEEKSVLISYGDEPSHHEIPKFFFIDGIFALQAS